MQEKWKDIVGFEKLYQVSNLGKIRRILFINNITTKPKISLNSQNLDKHNYYRVYLNKKGKRYNKQVHRLVAEAFLNKKDFKSMPDEDRALIDLNKLEVNHKNEKSIDNRIENLEWCTHKYNMNYGTIKTRKSNTMSKHNIGQYNINNELIKIWRTLNEIQDILHISKQSISMCCNMKTKTAGGFVWRYINE